MTQPTFYPHLGDGVPRVVFLEDNLHKVGKVSLLTHCRLLDILGGPYSWRLTARPRNSREVYPVGARTASETGRLLG